AYAQHPFRESPVYTGPYRFDRWDRGDRLVLVRNEDYWKNKLTQGAVPNWTVGQPWIDSIALVLYKESGSSVKDLLAGRLDVDIDVEPQTWIGRETNAPAFTDKIVRAKRVG